MSREGASEVWLLLLSNSRFFSSSLWHQLNSAALPSGRPYAIQTELNESEQRRTKQNQLEGPLNSRSGSRRLNFRPRASQERLISILEYDGICSVFTRD